MVAPRAANPTALAMTLIAWLPCQASAQPASDLVREGLRNRIETAGLLPLQFVVEGEVIHASQTLPIFYESRAYAPAWSDGHGPSTLAIELVRSIEAAEEHGLVPEDYHLAAIRRLLSGESRERESWSTGDLIDLDLILTDAFLVYTSHLLSGRVNPETFDREWLANRRERDLAGLLDIALATGGIHDALESVLPEPAGYRRLRAALQRYREIALEGGWPTVPEGPKLARGDLGPRVAALRSRLATTDGPIDDGSADFDEELEGAVIRFQRRHGLDADGVVGLETLAALNAEPEERARQIALNLERWRWLPQDMGDRYIVVNIANFELDVVEDGEVALTMRVVVGRPYRRTPVFTDQMTYLVLSPYWHVPRNLAVQDILPQIKKDPAYLEMQRIRLFRTGSDGSPVEVPPGAVDWATVSATNFDLRLRQDPGPLNALGDVKFMFPNRFNVYLHDTPARGLFARSARDFSSGCIRIERPIDLAEYLLRDDPRWSRDRILATIRAGSETTVRLPRAIPVHLLYWTAWVEDGTVHFRRDVYGRDAALAAALRSPPTR